MALITDHEARALAKLLEQYKDKTRITAILKALTAQVQDEEDTLDDLLTKRGLAVATAAQLDTWGEILDQPRGGLDDTTYRTLLFIRIIENFSEGTIEDLISVFNTLMGSSKTQLLEIFPASINLTAIDATPLIPLLNVKASLRRAKAAGVGIGALVETTAIPFVFEGDTDGLGFDDGELSNGF